MEKVETNQTIQEINPSNPINEEPKRTRRKKENPMRLADKRYSNHFLTYNTNQQVYKMSKEQYSAFARKFKSVIKNFCEVLPTSPFLVLEGFTPKSKVPLKPLPDNLEDRIESAEISSVIEIGETGRLHAHILFALGKRGLNTQLNYPAIKKFLDDNMGQKGYLNHDVKGDAKANIENYMNKTI